MIPVSILPVMVNDADANAAFERERRRERRHERTLERRSRMLAEATVRMRARREGWLEFAPPDGASARAIRAAAPRTIGIRAAKTKLGEVVRDVRAGRDWLITDHGRPVARLVPIRLGDLSLRARLRQLEQVKLLDPAPANPRVPEPIRVGAARVPPRRGG